MLHLLYSFLYQVVESWDRIDEVDSAPYNVVQIKPGEPIGIEHMASGDWGQAAALASGYESGSGASSSSRGRKREKNGKEEWKPFARANSLSPRPGGKRSTRRMQSLSPPKRMSVPRTRVLPKMKTPLKDILHKQREQEEEEDKSEELVGHAKNLCRIKCTCPIMSDPIRPLFLPT